MACRTLSKAQKALEDIRSTLDKNSGSVHVMQLDLSSFTSIREFAREFKQSKDKTDPLVRTKRILW